MPSETTESSLPAALLRPAFLVVVLLLAGFAYSVLILQRVAPFVMAVTTLASVAITAFVLWLLYRLVVAVEEIAETTRRIEASLDDE